MRASTDEKMLEMNNNDVFRTVLHLTGVGRNKQALIEIFMLGGIQATDSKVKGWRTEINNPRATKMPDHVLEAFFQGFFEYRDRKLDAGISIFNLIDGALIK